MSAGSDPQLAVLYTLVSLTLGVWGAGKYSFDAWLAQMVEPER
jgi:hypothetical protein